MIKHLCSDKENVWNNKNVVDKNFLVKYANNFLYSCKEIPGVKKGISEKQINLLINLLDENCKKFFHIKLKFLANGDLEFEEVDGILQRRNLMGKASKDVII